MLTIIESVDTIIGDGPDVTYHITKTKLSRKWYTFKTSNLHHRVLRVILHLVIIVTVTTNVGRIPLTVKPV